MGVGGDVHAQSAGADGEDGGEEEQGLELHLGEVLWLFGELWPEGKVAVQFILGLENGLRFIDDITLRSPLVMSEPDLIRRYAFGEFESKFSKML